MKKILVAIALALALCGNTYACIAKMVPDENLGNYSQIFIAEISGVHLVEYEKARLKSLARGDDRRYFTDITQTQKLNLIVTKVFVGKPNPHLEINVGGCGIATPNPGMFGIFFVNKESGDVIPIYENEGKLYYELLVKLGKVNR